MVWARRGKSRGLGNLLDSAWGVEDDFLEKGMPNLKPVGGTEMRQKRGEQNVGSRLREEHACAKVGMRASPPSPKAEM